MNLWSKLAEKIGVVAQAGSTVNIGEVRVTGELTRQEYQNRQAILAKVNNFWIKGVLEKSLHEQVLIALRLEERPNSVESPWNLMFGTENRPPQELTEGISVLSIFDEIDTGRTLLILGEPGSGKTITLLQLARDLIVRARQDVNYLIPIVLNLSSWQPTARKGKSLVQVTVTDWVIEELNSKYQVSKNLAKKWVRKQQLLLLLDGLDEVQVEYRDACVTALNIFQQQAGTEMVVCCRSRDYEVLTNRLIFQKAVYLRPLTQHQVNHYLDNLLNVGVNLSGLRTILETNSALQELAQSPLMLNVMMLAHQEGMADYRHQHQSVEDYRIQLFDSYIQLMFNRRGIDRRYSQDQSTQWLRWLAQQMQVTAQTIFLIEQLQPFWLSTRVERRAYRLGSILIGGLIGGLLLGLTSGLPFSLLGVVTQGLENGLGSGLFIGLMNGLIGGVSAGLSIGLRGGLKGGITGALLGGTFFGLLTGLGYEPIFASLVPSSPELSSAGLITGIVSGIANGLTIGLNVGLAGGQSEEIQTAEKYNWSWKGARRGLSIGVIVGLVLGLIIAVLPSWKSLGISNNLLSMLIFALFTAPLSGLGGGIIAGLNPSSLETTELPNQGIRRSAKNSVFGMITGIVLLGLAGVLVMGLIGLTLGLWTGENLLNALLIGLFMGLLGGVLFGLLVGSLIGLGVGLKNGGKACIQHFTLRLILYRNKYIPWNYAHFLDYAVDRLFLQKVGGGYIFIHRMLLEHFAAMDLSPSKR